MSAGDTTPADRASRDAWLEEAGEAAALPPDDPQRKAFADGVQERGGWAQAWWTTLLRENEVWRAALSEGEMPDGVRRRLDAIADQHRPRLRRRATRARLLGTGVAAATLLALGTWLLLGTSDPTAATLRDVALLALNDHLDTHDQDVLSEDPAALRAGLQAYIPFPVEMPDLGAPLHPVGGRKCTLGSHVVAFSAWRGPGGRLTLLQLWRHDFSLPADLPAQIITPRGAASNRRPLDVFFFGRGDSVFVVVADDAEDLRRVRGSVGSS